MTKTENDAALKFIWKKRLKLRAKGVKLYVEGNKFRSKGGKLWAEGNKAKGDKLYAEGNKFRAKGDKLYAEGDKLWLEGILAIKGNITMKWIGKDGHLDCKLETGEIFNG